jgi:hypothetical protein
MPVTALDGHSAGEGLAATGIERAGGPAMAQCEVCGNDYDLSFEVHAQGAVHTFDSFECAIHAMAPVCDHCGVKIAGHGLQAEGSFYCCANCARMAGHHELVDNSAAART